MEARDTDVVYLIAVRTREPNRGRAIQELLRVLSLARADEDTEYSAHVAARELSEVDREELRSALLTAGFDSGSAIEVVPGAPLSD